MREPGASAEPDQPTPTRRVWLIVFVISAVAMIAAAVVVKGSESGAGGAPSAAEELRVPVRVRSAERSTLTLTGSFPGELRAETAELAVQATGRLQEVRVNIGDRVKKGQMLARVDATQTQRQIEEAQAQIRAAEAARSRALAELAAARAELDRATALLKDRLITQQEVDVYRSRIDILNADVSAADAQKAQAEARARLLGEQVRETRLLAPFDGAVAERHLDPGVLVQPGTTVLRLVRSGPLRVAFRVAERDLGRITLDMPFELTTQATGPRRFTGAIQRISAEVSRQDRTTAAEGLLDEELSVLRPGMYADVRVTFGTLENTVVVPSAAVVERADREGRMQTGVFVVDEGKALWRPVVVKGRVADQTAVEGLQEESEVVTLGHAKLRDGTPVRKATASER